MNNNIRHVFNFFFLITFFNFEGSASSKHYGINIEQSFWGQAEHQRGLRVLLFDIEKQRVLEVNHYIQVIKKGEIVKGGHVLDPNEHNAIISPLKAFIFKENAEKFVIVAHDFNTDLYTVISQIPLYRLRNQIDDFSTLTSTDFEPEIDQIPSLERLIDNTRRLIYAAEKAPIGSKQLESKFVSFNSNNQRIQHSPTFRLIDMMGTIPTRTKTSPFLGEALLQGGRDKEQDYSWGKEQLGEICATLTLFSYGYRDIYDAKLAGMFGFDIIFSSGTDSSQDELFIAEAKWTCHTHAPSTFLKKELNIDTIVRRIKDLKYKSETQQAKAALSLIENFFTTSNARIYRMIYHVSDVKDRKNRGTVRPCFAQISEEERRRISNDAQLEYTSLIPAMTNLSVSPPQQRTFDHNTGNLKRFMEILYPKYTPELWQLLAKKYPQEYAKWSQK